jgi:hypothetical protein
MAPKTATTVGPPPTTTKFRVPSENMRQPTFGLLQAQKKVVPEVPGVVPRIEGKRALGCARDAEEVGNRPADKNQ